MKSISLIPAIILVLLIACARQTSPSGGPKDETPPVLLKSNPADQQINVKTDVVELTFNEMVITNNPREQVIITPSVGKKFELTARKNKILLKFEEPLRDSTTYTINFREAVQDITERNPAENLSIAFSTGSYLDSLSISGSVYDLLTRKEVKDITVAVFQPDSFNIFFQTPEYFTKADNAGNFKITNLKPGNYYIYAFEDKNKNLIVDSKNEMYGFLQDYIVLSENVKSIEIPLITLNASSLRFINSRPYSNYYNIRTSKAIKDYRITTTEPVEITTTYGDDRSNVRVYNTIGQRDSLQVRFQAFDSIQHYIDTTVFVKFSTRENMLLEKFPINVDNLRILTEDGVIEGDIKFTKPIKTFNFDSLYYKVDSTTLIKFTADDLTYDVKKNQIRLYKKIDKKYFVVPEPPANADRTKPQAKPAAPKDDDPELKKLIARKAAFISIDNDSMQAKTYEPKMLKRTDTGTLFIDVQTSQPAFIVELLSKDFKVVRREYNKKNLRFDYLAPGDYQVRMIIDANQNEEWDPGNYYANEEPEKVIFYKSEENKQSIILRANFEIGPLLIKY